MTDHPDPTALRLEGQRLVEAIDAATTMIEEGVRGMAKSDCDGGGFLERNDAREIAREVIEAVCPTLLTTLSALTEERDRLREQLAVMEGVWRTPDEVPAMPSGGEGYFIVAVRRHHSGKVWTFPATYIRDFVLRFDADDTERAVTGWFSAEANGDDGSTYQDLLYPGDEMIAWREVGPQTTKCPTRPACTGNVGQVSGRKDGAR